MPNKSEIERIAKRLSKAQRRWLTSEAQWISNGFPYESWWTFPPANTWQVLVNLDLLGRGGLILPLGRQVRARLQDQS